MKNKNIVFISVLISLICLTGCNITDKMNDLQEIMGKIVVSKIDKTIDFQEELDNLSENSYAISSMTYNVEDDNNNISIEYPVVTGLSDEANQIKTNKLIKAEALKVYDYYNDDRDSYGHLKLHILYDISLESEHILSIRYAGWADLEGLMHPHKWYYTTNIDMMTGNRLRLADMVSIEEGFINMFISGEFEPLCVEQVENEDGELDLGYYGSYDTAEEGFINADNMGSIFSYLTKDTLGIVIPVSHAIGGNAQLEIRYEDIAEYFIGDMLD